MKRKLLQALSIIGAIITRIGVSISIVGAVLTLSCMQELEKDERQE